MEKQIRNICIQNKYDTDENWKSVNPILYKGEQVISIDGENRVRTKTGDGSTAYSLLPFDDEYLLAMIDELTTVVDNINTYVTKLQNGEVTLVQPMLVAKVQEDE